LADGASSAGHPVSLAFPDISKTCSRRNHAKFDPTDDHRGADHAVFVQTNDPAGNSIVAYARHDDGTLTWAATYPTGGNGARAAGAAVDPLASQSSLVIDNEHGLLLAPNAGSNTVTERRKRLSERLRGQQQRGAVTGRLMGGA
jgi:hypothetical protein